MSQPSAWVEKGAENEYTAVFATAYLRILKEPDLTERNLHGERINERFVLFQGNLLQTVQLII